MDVLAHGLSFLGPWCLVHEAVMLNEDASAVGRYGQSMLNAIAQFGKHISCFGGAFFVSDNFAHCTGNLLNICGS